MKQKITLSLPKSIENAVKDENFRVYYSDSGEELEIMLYGTVGDDYTQSDAGSISRMLSKDRKRPVTMKINSGGGLAYDGMAIYNALADHKGPTTAVIESLAASAASLAAIGADRVKMYHNATFMIHEGLMFAYGHVAELKQAVAWLDKFNAAAAEVYAEKSGKTVEEINAALLGPNGDGTYYSAAEAFSMGFVDEILTAGSSKKQKQKNETAKLQSMLNYRIAKSALTNRREPV